MFPSAQLALDLLIFGLMTLTFLLAPGLRRSPRWLVLGAGVFMWVGFKFLALETGGLNWTYLGILLVEVFFLLLIAGLAYEISAELEVLHRGERVLGIGTAVPPALDSETGLRLVQQEMRRSRRQERPLSLIVFNPFPLDKAQPPALAVGIPANLQVAYQKARISEVINHGLRLADLLLVERRQERFVIICPETPPHEAELLANVLAQTIHREFGFVPACAVTSFPADGLTFNRLLTLAAARLENAAPGNQPILTRVEEYGENQITGQTRSGL
ncbi:MAG: hypothetical protein IPM39_01165 [Chloroflexi bacterium]|nr:hypothetical protein [Chloroflexota bacterium]